MVVKVNSSGTAGINIKLVPALLEVEVSAIPAPYLIRNDVVLVSGKVVLVVVINLKKTTGNDLSNV